MNSTEEQVVEEIKRLHQATEEMLELNYEDEQDLIRLDRLQSCQVYCRENVDKLIRGNLKLLTAESRLLLQECMQLERRHQQKLLANKHDAQLQLNRLKAGSKIRGAYGEEFQQADGYFIDKRK